MSVRAVTRQLDVDMKRSSQSIGVFFLGLYGRGACGGGGGGRGVGGRAKTQTNLASPVPQFLMEATGGPFKDSTVNVFEHPLAVLLTG